MGIEGMGKDPGIEDGIFEGMPMGGNCGGGRGK